MKIISAKSTILFLAALLTLGCLQAQAQSPAFTRQDTLRGSITKERGWWDVSYYHLDVRVNPADSTLFGKNTIRYKVLEPLQVMQIDLQPPMRIEKVLQNGKQLEVVQEGNAHFVQLQEPQAAGTVKEVEVYYGGKPQVSVNPPWSGGVTWKRDSRGNPFVATSNQGDGASLWWPCKDHMYDEPDSMLISVAVPQELTNVSNGRLLQVDDNRDGTRTFHWFVSNPINNYGVNINIGDYVHFGEQYQGEKGTLDCDYYVLRDNLGKAKKQFQDVPRTLQAFEHWFGPYPFYEDSYKLVEVPYLGMEHQSSVTYGNGFQNGYLGRDLSGTGWGMKFDFIIVHETGHEWFANNITYRDAADMWIHESFTSYSESLFLDYHYGTQAGNEYTIGKRRTIRNDRPIIGFYDVNHSGSGDMYNKGANMLHTLRQIMKDDGKFREMLRGLNRDFYHQTVTTAQIENYLAQYAGRNLGRFFDQYLRDTRIPVLEYRQEKNRLLYRWANTVDGFDMPVKVYLNEQETWLEPDTSWKEMKKVKAGATLTIDPNFYVQEAKRLGTL